MITASMDIDRFINQLSTMMAAEKSSETNCRTRHVTGDDYRPPLFDPANERNQLRSRYWVEPHSYESIECDQQPEKLQWTRRVVTMMRIITSTGFDTTNKRNRIPFLQVNWSRSSVREPTINGAILPLNGQYREPKAKSTDDCESAQLPLHPFKLSKVHRLQ